ncbi:MAG: efflux RND transporter permease subunit [Gammaproteobacteria bacterium]|nr:efflux RND transporter permease subunit [Gammaproteobacteria bacterium]
MGLIELATDRRITILMFTLAITLFGIVSLTRLKVNLLPDLAHPTITVRTELSGTAPLEIENLITKPVEEAVGIIKNVQRVRSVSRSGQSDVIIEFLWGTDMDIASVDVREKLDLIELPLEAVRPILLRFDPSNEPIVRLALLQEKSTETEALRVAQLKALRRYAEEQLKNEIEAIEGTAAVKISGGLEDEIRILVDQQRLAKLGIPISVVAQRIRGENVNLAGGRLEQGSQRFLVRTINEFQSIDAIANAIVASPDGQPVYLRDIATVERGYKERQAITRVRGIESVELAVYKEGDANTVQVARRIKPRLEKIKESLPEGVELQEIYDQSLFISQAINQVLSAALLGGLLAVIVLYSFLRDVRATLIIGAAIPVSVIGTFVLMYASDLTLNIMSLGGIALAVGLLVDNAIVVLENIVRKREAGADVLQAARTGTKEVTSAIIAATLTTVAVFFPMVFVHGIAGQLFRDQSLTVTFALLFSLLVALTLIPMMAAWRAGHHFSDSQDSRPPALFTRIIASLVRFVFIAFALLGKLLRLLITPIVIVFQGINVFARKTYPPLLAWALRNRLIVVVVATAIFIATMSLVPRLGTELIPQLSQGEFSVDLRLAPGSPLDSTDDMIQRAQQTTQGLDEVELTFSVAGTGNRLDASPVDAGENSGSLNVQLKPDASRAQETQVMNAMRSELDGLAGLQYEFRRPELFSFANPLEVEISGYDLESLEAVSQRIYDAMTQSGRFTDLRTSSETGNPEVQILFDQERAAKLGLSVRDIADRVVSKVRGELATRYTWRDRKIDVLIRSVDERDASLDDVRRLIVNPQSDRPVTLDAVADIVIARGPTEIRRIDQERVILISADTSYGDLGSAVAEVEQILAATPMPAEIGARVAGQNSDMEESFQSMRFALLLAVFLVYLVMAAQFESIIHPFVILLTIPLALVGAVLALTITNAPINVVVLIGVIMLAGIVVNNGIVLIDLVNQLRLRGASKLDALMEAGQARLRPILMTTLTTVLGLLPMAIGFGEGAEVRAPMAITVIGGLLVSTGLTLLVIPVVYSLLDRKTARYSNPELGTAQTEAAR